MALAALTTGLLAQETNADPLLVAQWQQVLERGLEDGRAHDTLARLVAAAPHRLSGSDGAAAAVEWARAEMTRLQLTNVRLEKVMVPRWVRGTATATVVGTDEPLGVLALGGSIATPAKGLEGDLVMVRSFEELRALGDAAKGKIAFLNRPMPRTLMDTFRAYGQAVPQRSNGAIEAGRVGALAVLVRSMSTRISETAHTGAMAYDPTVERVPAAALATAHADRLGKRIAAGETVRIRLTMTCETHPDVESANVVGEIRGTTHPDEIVLIGAHLDAWDVGHGAHDDGAGCAHVLEAMRLIRALDWKPARTIRAVLFMNEENGLRGGTTYAADHLAELPRHFAAIETDRGGFVPIGFDTTATGAKRDLIARLAAPLRANGMGAVIPGGGGADISPMGPHGVTLIGLLVQSHRYFDHHHSDRDTIDAVNDRELQLGACALAYLATALADAR